MIHGKSSFDQHVNIKEGKIILIFSSLKLVCL